MFYILLLIILISITYKKYTDITNKYLYDEKYNNYDEKYTNYNALSYLNYKGIKYEVPVLNNYKLGCGEHNSIYNVFSKALGNIYGINMGLVNTHGTIENLEKVNIGKLDFALVQEDLLLDSIIGLNRFKYNKLNNIRCICRLYNELYFLIVNKESNINSLSELKNGFSLKGKNYIIGTGREKSGSLEILKLLCNVYNINLIRFNKKEQFKNINNKNGNLYYIPDSLNKNFNYLLSGEIDAIFHISGPKLSYIINLSSKMNVKFIPFKKSTNRLFNEITGNNNKFKNIIIKDNTYIFNNYEAKTVETMAINCVLICNKKISNDVIYNYTKSIYKNLNYLRNYMFNEGNQLIDFSPSHVYFNQNNENELREGEPSAINNKKDIYNYNIVNKISMYDSYSNEFNPLEMFYINKHIKYHPGSYKFYKDIGYIHVGEDKNCKYNIKSGECILVPSLDLKKVYWKYDKIPGLLNKFKR